MSRGWFGKAVRCRQCDGRGSHTQIGVGPTEPCPGCDGHGWTLERDES